MDLPFAVDFPERGDSTMLGHSSSSSLMMASGSPSFFPSEQSGVYTKPQQQQQQQQALETETIDFTFVHAESDSDEVDVVIDGGTMPNEGIEQPKGDILAVLLSGTAQQNGGEYITVRFRECNQIFCFLHALVLTLHQALLFLTSAAFPTWNRLRVNKQTKQPIKRQRRRRMVT